MATNSRTTSSSTSAASIQKYLKGAKYPSDKDALMGLANDNGAPEDVTDILEQFPDDVDFESVTDVQQCFSDIEGKKRSFREDKNPVARKERPAEKKGDEEDSDDDRQPNGQGRVKNPETDGRLKQNRDDSSDSDDEEDSDDDRQPNGQGRVKNPETDGRLKQNRDDNKTDEDDDEDDENRQPNGQGRVKNPETDGRLKQNRNRTKGDDRQDDEDDDRKSAIASRTKNQPDNKSKQSQDDDEDTNAKPGDDGAKTPVQRAKQAQTDKMMGEDAAPEGVASRRQPEKVEAQDEEFEKAKAAYEQRKKQREADQADDDNQWDRRLKGHETKALKDAREMKHGYDGRGRVTDPENDRRLSGQETDALRDSRHMKHGYDGRGRVRKFGPDNVDETISDDRERYEEAQRNQPGNTEPDPETGSHSHRQKDDDGNFVRGPRATWQTRYGRSDDGAEGEGQGDSEDGDKAESPRPGKTDRQEVKKEGEKRKTWRESQSE